MKANFFSENFELQGLSTGQVVRVRQGSSFELQVEDDANPPAQASWFADEDHVLTVSASSLTTGPSTAKAFKAESVGTSEVLILGPKPQNSAARPLLFSLSIEVFSSEAQGFTKPAPVREPV